MHFQAKNQQEFRLQAVSWCREGREEEAEGVCMCVERLECGI